MQVMKHLHEVPFDDIPKLLIEFSWETVWSWRFVMIHIKDCIPNLFSVKGATRNAFSSELT